MKSVAVLALAGAASAQVSLYLSIASAVDGSIGKLDSAIKAYTGGAGSEVIASASALLSVINSGSAAAAKGQTIDQFPDALSLLTPYENVASSVKGVVGDLDAKSSLVSKNSLGGVAYSLLQQESAAAVALAGVITSKITGDASLARPIAASSVINPILSAVNSGLAVFSGIKGQGGSGSGSTTSSGSSSSSSSGSSSSSSSGSTSTSTSTETTTTSTGAASTSSTPPQFTGNSAAGLQVGGVAAAAVGALAYIL